LDHILHIEFLTMWKLKYVAEKVKNKKKPSLLKTKFFQRLKMLRICKHDLCELECHMVNEILLLPLCRAKLACYTEKKFTKWK